MKKLLIVAVVVAIAIAVYLWGIDSEAEAPPEAPATALTGQVVDISSRAPLTAAQVCIQHTTRCASTDETGTYTLTDLDAAGEQVVEVSAAGYTAAVQSITPAPNATTTQDFALTAQNVIAVCGGTQGIACPASQVCDLGAGSCAAAGAEGVCVQRPEACAEIFEPVCGCDGTTYSNDCFRLMAGVQKNYDGECRGICGGTQGIACPASQVCDLGAGSCAAAGAEGVCVQQPEACPEIFDPVCGCDGTTYSNDCFRLMAGVQKTHDGEC